MHVPPLGTLPPRSPSPISSSRGVSSSAAMSVGSGRVAEDGSTSPYGGSGGRSLGGAYESTSSPARSTGRRPSALGAAVQPLSPRLGISDVVSLSDIKQESRLFWTEVKLVFMHVIVAQCVAG